MPTDKKQKEQSALFEKTAREHGADGEKSAADVLMGKLAHTPPDPKAAKKPKPKKPAK